MALPKLVPDLEERIAALPPEQQAEARQLLNDYYTALEENPLYRFDPHAKQQAFLGIQTRIGMAIAGNRFGKTAIGLVGRLIQNCDSEAVPDHLRAFKRWDPKEHGPIRGRICAPKFNENIEQVIFPELKKWVPRNQLLGGGWDSAFSKSKRVLTFANGSTIQFLTYDQDVDAHAGASLHWVLFDEEPEGEKGRQLYQENQTRLADLDGDFRITMTPLFGMSWAFEEIYEQADTDPDITVVQGDSYENPHVNRERLRKDAAKMTKEERQARREGKFVHFAGQFYPEFGEEHKAPAPKRKHLKDQSIIVGIDPGLNYTGLTWVAFDNDNVALMFAERKPEQTVVSEVAEIIKAVNAQWGIDPDYYVIDPSARNRSTINAEAIENAYLRAGIPTIHGQNDRAAGILEVKRRLQVGPGLFVSEDCPMIMREFRRYRRDPNSSDEFAAVKKDDHCFPAGTMVSTETGLRGIETVAAGERVWTRQGLFSVLDSGLTREDAQLHRVALEDGTVLAGSDNHPVLCGDGSWRRLDSVRYGDILWVCPDDTSALNVERKSSGTASVSTAIRTPLTPEHGLTSRRHLSAYIAPSGRPRTDPFLTGCTSITSTAIQPTTTSPTSSSLTRAHISGGTREHPSVERPPASTCTAFAISRRTGTAAPRARRGTANTASGYSPNGRPGSSLASFAVRFSRAKPTEPSTALRSADRLSAARMAWTTKPAPVLSADRISSSTSTPSRGLVPVRVLESTRAGRSAVYNLTVDGPSEYFANGVLVHNCLDALRYVLMERVWTVTEETSEPVPETWTPGTAPPAEFFDRQPAGTLI